MTDTQERVAINQITNKQRFGFLRRLLNSFVAGEWFTYAIIATVVVVGAMYHHHSINSLEARFETTVEKMLDKWEKRSRAFIEEAIKTSETNIAGKFVVHKNCAELYKSGKIISGVYAIDPDGIGPDFKVFCDQKTAGGGWTVVQKRLDGSVDFNRSWSGYENGFGDLNGELWLGLDKIHRLTTSTTKLRVDLEDFDGNTAYAEYAMFAVANAIKKYELTVTSYSGTAGDSLTELSGHSFSTKDQDNDNYFVNCAVVFKGGWWYYDFCRPNLNGVYRDSADGHGVSWNGWEGMDFSSSLKRAEMKIRPVEF